MTLCQPEREKPLQNQYVFSGKILARWLYGPFRVKIGPCCRKCSQMGEFRVTILALASKKYSLQTWILRQYRPRLLHRNLSILTVRPQIYLRQNLHVLVKKALDFRHIGSLPCLEKALCHLHRLQLHLRKSRSCHLSKVLFRSHNLDRIMDEHFLSRVPLYTLLRLWMQLYHFRSLQYLADLLPPTCRIGC